ncbi:MAG: putative metal-binding motif-containing protein [Deltaproteobacteria bacterium]|nr:putative metal-binding motif-containing protein [Deltaproteobacteria bacterium]
MRNSTLVLYIISLLFLFTACSAPSSDHIIQTINSQATDTSQIGVTEIDENTPPTSEPDQEIPSTFSNSPSAGPSTPPISIIDPKVTPAASLPLPEARKQVAVSPDQNDSMAVVGFEGAAEYKAGYKIAVSTTAIEPVVSCNEPTIFEKAKEMLMPRAYAQSEAQSVCESDGVGCCDVNPDGSYECFLSLVNESVSEVYVALIDDFGNVSNPVIEQVRGNLKYVREKPTDVAVVGDDVYTVTDGKIVRVGYDSTTENFKTAGDKDTGYKEAETVGTQIVYYPNATQDVLAVRNETGGICLNAKTSTGTENCTSETIKTVDGAEKYSVLKYANGIGYVGVRVQEGSATNAASVFDVCEGIGLCGHNDINTRNDFDYITDSDGLSFRETIAFDINKNNKGIFVFKDADNKIRIRFSDGLNRFGGKTEFTGVASIDVKDIKLISDTKALMLDGTNNKVWQIEIDENNETVTHVLNSAVNGVAVGKKPVSMQFNSDMSRAYVLNETDETVDVINLKNSDNSVRVKPEVVATKNLKDALSGKTLDIAPKAMVIEKNQIVVASEALKSLVFVDKDNIVEAELADEDNDLDGDGDPNKFYGGGDCNDNNSAVNSYVPEICGDGIDNDCDGETDGAYKDNCNNNESLD